MPDQNEVIRIADIIGGADVAQLYGMGRTGVTMLAKRHPDFPKPIASVNDGKTQLFDRQQMLAWGRLTLRVPLEEGRVYDSNGYDVTDRAAS